MSFLELVLEITNKIEFERRIILNIEGEVIIDLTK